MFYSKMLFFVEKKLSSSFVQDILQISLIQMKNNNTKVSGSQDATKVITGTR